MGCGLAVSVARYAVHHSLSLAVRDQNVRKTQRVSSPASTAHRTRRKWPATDNAVSAFEIACWP